MHGDPHTPTARYAGSMTNQPEPKAVAAEPKTRTQCAAERAVQDLQALLAGKYDGDPSHALRDVMFSLASAYHTARIQGAADSIMTEGRERFPVGGDYGPNEPEDFTEEQIASEAELLCTHTADNLTTTLASSNDEAWRDVFSESEPVSLEQRAYLACEADLRAALAAQAMRDFAAAAADDEVA